MLKEQVTFIDDKTQEFLLGNIDDTRTIIRNSINSLLRVILPV